MVTSPRTIKEYLIPYLGGNQSSDNQSMLINNLDIHEMHDNFEPPEILSGSDFNVKLTKFN